MSERSAIVMSRGTLTTSAPRKVGQLYKKSGLVHSWKPRYFALEGSILYYYKREGDSVPKGIVVLLGCVIQRTQNKKYFSFRITHPKSSKVYDLSSTLQSRTDEWITVLREAAAASPLTSSSSSSLLRSDSSSVLDTPLPPHLPLSSFSEAEIHAIEAEQVHLPSEYGGEMEAVMCEFMSQIARDASGWKLQSEERQCKVYSRKESKKMNAFKAIGDISHSPYAILKLLLTIERRGSFDPQLLGTRRVHVYDDHTFIDHLLYKPVFPATGRDFMHLTHWRVLANGSILILAMSIDEGREYQMIPTSSTKDMVRGFTYYGGFLLQPKGEKETSVSYMVKADLKGGIPSSLQSKMFMKQAFVIDGLRGALEEEEDEDGEKEQDPEVTNATVFNLHTSDFEQDNDDLTSSRAESVEVDMGDETTSTPSALPPVVDMPEEGLPAVPPQYRSIIEKAIQRLEVDMDDASAWNFHSEKNGVKAYTKVEGSLTAAKGEGHIPYSPRAIWNIIYDVDNKYKYDSTLAVGKRLVNINGQTGIDYLEYKPVLIVAGRDFLNLVHWRVLSNGTILLIAQGIEDLDLCPLKEPKVVRGEIHIAGWRIVPDADYQGAQISYMVKTDLKGNIPSRIVSRSIAEQPYLVHAIHQALKKRTDLNDLVQQGKLVNTIFDFTGNQEKFSKPVVQESSRPPLPVASSSLKIETKPSTDVVKSPLPPVKERVQEKSGDVKTPTSSSSSPPSPLFLVMNGVQFLIAVLAIQYVSISNVIHTSLILFLLVWFTVRLYMGPSHMSPRRKLMIASFAAPDMGMIYGSMTLDVTKTRQYIAEKRASTGSHITITHIVLRAIAEALGQSPSVNGHIVLGEYYPSSTVEMGCLVAIQGGKDLGIVHLSKANELSLAQICQLIEKDAKALRSGKNKEQEERNQILNVLPTWIIRPIVNLTGWLGGALGLEIKPLGVKPYMFGSCMVTSVGMMGLELAFAPITPFAQTPVLVTIGAIQETVVVRDGHVVIRPILTLTTTIDHRYVDGSQAARMSTTLRRLVEDPYQMEAI